MGAEGYKLRQRRLAKAGQFRGRAWSATTAASSVRIRKRSTCLPIGTSAGVDVDVDVNRQRYDEYENHNRIISIMLRYDRLWYDMIHRRCHDITANHIRF